MAQKTPPPIKEQTTAPQNQQAQTPPPESNDFFRSAEGAGMENVDRLRDLQTPYLSIVQANSPELKRENSKYIKGAEQGDIFNTVTREIYKSSAGEKLVVIPCGFIRVYNQWKLRVKGGGFVKTFFEGQQPQTRKGSKEGQFDDAGTTDLLVANPEFEIKTTAMHSVLVCQKDGSRYPAILSFVSTQLKKSRQWLSKMDAKRICDSAGASFRPPSFAFAYELSTVVEKSAKGDEFWGWRIEEHNKVTREQFDESFAMHKASASQPSLPPPPDSGEHIEGDEAPY